MLGMNEDHCIHYLILERLSVKFQESLRRSAGCAFPGFIYAGASRYLVYRAAKVKNTCIIWDLLSQQYNTIIQAAPYHSAKRGSAWCQLPRAPCTAPCHAVYADVKGILQWGFFFFSFFFLASSTHLEYQRLMRLFLFLFFFYTCCAIFMIAFYSIYSL